MDEIESDERNVSERIVTSGTMRDAQKRTERMGFTERIRDVVSSLLAAPQQESDPGTGLLEKAKKSGEPFRDSPYFQEAEKDMDMQWANLIFPLIREADFRCVLDLAAGHGRNSAKLKQYAGRLIIVDINQECIDQCKKRFKGEDRIEYIRNDGVSLKGIEDDSVTLIFSFDAMVHFDKDVIREYLKEFFRVLQPGGRGFCHHSNYTGNFGGDFMKSPHLRNYMSKDLFAHYCGNAGLEVILQKTIDWDKPQLDCLTLFEKGSS